VISAVPDSFTFEVLDDLSFAAAGQRLPTLPQGAYRFDGLGPALELARLSTCGLLPPPTQAPWLVLDDAANLANALRDGRRVWTCREKHLGFLRMQAEPPADDTEGNAFQLEAQRAATAVGFPAKLAAQLVGAFEEIHSNVYDHSGTPASGIAAYRATTRRFEFVVSDGGMGVLKSLQSCPEYADLTDHGDALRLALQDGISRYGKGTSHGRGFRPLFTGLANVSGALRFRSGDQALTIDGRNAGSIPAQTWEKVFSPGFVASVLCTL
jgi:anti-sigma regulatory factor (Ser/Thr protein kinase)